tara:strand:+ start:332 stop:1993 length:1662 start_codon:yes stop_codon:yes gene_type:complete
MKRTLTVVGVTLLLLTGLVQGQRLSNPRVPLFTPVDITADIDGLPESERAALARILKAAKIMDGLFLEQVWTGNPSLLLQLQDTQNQVDRDVLDFFLINKGPWSRLEENRPFVAGVPEKPKGAGYYPTDATREEITAWIDGLSDSDRRKATGFFTTIRRDASGSLQAVPYSLEYQGPLDLAATHLREAAALTTEPSLKKYLKARATAFRSNEYYDSDIAWMELDSSIEPTIGPYEVYEDEWFNYKAAFEAFVTIRDDIETAQLSRFSNELQELEDNLPVHPDYRNPQLGSLAPIRVVNVVFTAGDANSGVQTAAFNLPNDERVIRDKGSKRVMLKNVQQAKFDHILRPITMVALSPQERSDVSFDAFFTHILMHELMHGLGPHSIQIDNQPTTVRQVLQETYSTIEEAKADISGLWALQRLIDKGVVDRSLERSIYTTFLASTFRSIRFGINEAHGRGIAIQLNTFLDTGAVTVSSDGTFQINHDRIPSAVETLTSRIMTIQAEGNYKEAQEMLEKLGVVRPEVQIVLDRLTEIPIDIRPIYATAEQLVKESP